jgi:flagellar assembly protein FliH
MEERVRELQSDAERRVAEGYNSGFSAGEAAGRAQAQNELQSVLSRLATGLSDVAECHSRVLRDAESDVLQLALEIARRIVHRELTIDPEAIQGIVNVSLKKLQTEKVHRVRVHPELEDGIRAALSRLGRAHVMDVVGDPNSERGAVVFETGRGSLDASLETQLREIERGFTDGLNES